MVRNTFLIVLLFLTGCATPHSNEYPVLGKRVVSPWGWDNEANGWCKRHQSDPDCREKNKR